MELGGDERRWCDVLRDMNGEIDGRCYANEHQKASHCLSSCPKIPYFHSCASHFPHLHIPAPPSPLPTPRPAPPTSRPSPLRPQHRDRSPNRASRAGSCISQNISLLLTSVGFEKSSSPAADDIAHTQQVAYEETGSFKAIGFVTDTGGKIYSYQ